MFLLGVAVGLIVGWNFFPQPAIVKDKVDQAIEKIKSVVTKKSDQ